MVVEVSSLTQAPLDFFGPWPRRKSVPTDDDIGYGPSRLQPAVVRHAARERPAKRVVKADAETAATTPIMRVHSLPTTPAPATVKQAEPRPASRPATPLSAPQKPRDIPPPAPAFAFSQILAPASTAFNFPPTAALPIRRTSVAKRARPRSDVDGEHTADLSSKKRRLRLRLITSRLSKPYCSPASHILNRDAIVSGDKRFLKLASNAEASKRLPNVQSSLLLRAAVLNRMRVRFCAEVLQRGGGGVTTPAAAGLPANAALLYQSLSHFTGARFVVYPQAGLEGEIASQLAQQKSAMPKPRMPAGCPVPLATRSRPSPSPPGTPHMRASDSRTRVPAAPRLRPLSSPELRPRRGLVVVDDSEDDDVDDQDSAFPTSEHESRYESSDDPEEVYSDFGLIFGQPGDEIEEEEEYDEHSYEEYLEELDGIPWLGL